MSNILYPQSIEAPQKNKGAHTIIHPQGYVMEYCPGHPNCNCNGMVMQHRLVMEEHLGRFLSGMEVVHHENEDKTDQRINNLKLFPSKGAHMQYHHKKKAKLYNQKIIKIVQRAALNSNTRVKDLKRLSISPSTVDRICKKYRINWVSAWKKNLDPVWVDKVLHSYPRQEICEILGVSVQSLWNNFPELMRKTANRKLKKWGMSP